MILTYFEIYGILISLLSIICIFLLTRLKGVFEWKLSLAGRLKILKKESLLKTGKDKEASEYVYLECKKLYRKLYLGKPEIIDLMDYISNIASIYNPEKEKPLYEISLGNCLFFANLFAMRIKEILHRRGFGIISELRVKDLYKGIDIYTLFSKNRFLKSLAMIWSNYSFVKLVLYLNPVGILFFLASSLIRMSIIKFIITDCYLFVGVHALKAYSGGFNEYPDFQDITPETEVEHSSKREVFADKELKRIKKDLFLKSLLIGSIPDIEKWTESVKESSEIISSSYFPESFEPLKEAKVGLLVERTALWLNFLSKLRDKKIVKYFFNIKMSSIIFAFDLKERYLPSFMKNNKYLEKGITLAGYSRTIYKLYKVNTPYGVASWAGGEYGKNILIFFILKSAYERMVCEVDIIYKNSR